MRICDVTLSYTETSGGIRTYLDAKRDYLLNHTDHEHVLIVPGEEDAQESHGRATTHRIASPLLPGCEPYRFFWRPGKIHAVLDECQPDVIELGSFYAAPWPAFRYRRERHDAGLPCLVAGYFHTDIADAYVGNPLRSALEDWPDPLEWLGEHAADTMEGFAEKYVGNVFDKCNLRMAASPQQASRLREYGVDDVNVVPLGVDLIAFSPARRSHAVRGRWGCSDSELVLLFAGRLDVEKHVQVLIDAVLQLPEELSPKLVLIGEGPLRDDLMSQAAESNRLLVLPYEQDKASFAALLASADIYVTAGPHETFGLSVIEAQASGLPVVGVEAGALTERVPKELGRLGPVDDVAAFADNIERVAEQRREIGRRSRSHVENHFGWSSTFQELLALYASALETGAEGERQLRRSVNF